MSRLPFRRAGLAGGAAAPLGGFEGLLAGIPWVYIADATQETEYAEDETVTRFHDQLGEADLDFTRTTGAVTYKAAGLGGAPGIKYFGGASLQAAGATLPADWSLATVMDVPQFISSLYSAGLTPANNPAIRRGASNNFEWHGDSGANVLAIKASASAGPHLIMASLEGAVGRVQIWFDGVQVVDDSNDRNYDGVSAINAIGQGGSAAMNLGMAGQTNVLWDADHRALMEAYAAEIWGVVLP